MTNFLRNTALATTLALTLSGVVNTASAETTIKLLTAKFDPRRIEKIEVGDFHFQPGQNAPIHTHTAPAVGFVTKGTIIYQIEGEAPKILRAGDAFYEPAGPRILRFDNASATQEAIFIDFNLEQTGEPFIVFEKKPTEAIDRRTLPTVEIGGKTIDHVEIYQDELASGGTLKLENQQLTVGIVAEGVIEIRVDGETTQRIIAGKSFSLPKPGTNVVINNASSEVSAKVITFRLRQTLKAS